MNVKKVLLAGCLASILFGNESISNTAAFVLNKAQEQKIIQSIEIKDDENVIYVYSIVGVGESLEKAKNDAIQNAMRFGVGEYLVTKEEGSIKLKRIFSYHILLKMIRENPLKFN